MCCDQQGEGLPANTGGSQGTSRSRVCARCEVAFEQRHRVGHYVQRHCSRRCAGFAEADRRRAQAVAATCPVCGRTFGAIAPGHTYCSSVCRRRARERRRYGRQRASANPEVILEPWRWT